MAATDEGDRRAWMHALQTEPPLISDDEQRVLILSLLHCRQLRGAGPTTEAECLQVVQWATNARTDEGLLANVLAGYVLVDVIDGDVRFMLTDKGRTAAKPLVDEVARQRGLPPLPSSNPNNGGR